MVIRKLNSSSYFHQMFMNHAFQRDILQIKRFFRMYSTHYSFMFFNEINSLDVNHIILFVQKSDFEKILCLRD
jgi:hypothetical protein